MFARRMSKDDVKRETDSDRRVTLAQTKAAKQAKSTIKLLILGAGGSGKTTLRKQFQRLYANGFNDVPSRKELREIVLSNLLEGAKAVVTAAQDPQIGGGLKSPESISAAQVIDDLSRDACTMNDGIAAALRTLAKEEAVKKAFVERNKFQLQECAIAYFNSLVASYPEWGGPSWIPSIDDCVRSRVRSSGIIEIEFEHEKTKFKVFDAGGQRAERRKWLHAFDDVTALIFVTSLTEYDEVLFEDRNQNRLVESMSVWEELTNSTHFVKTPILLFLNKLDLFQEKYLQRCVPLNISGKFPDAPGGEPDLDAAIEWFSKIFLAKRTKGDPSLVYIHTTTAVDSHQIDTVFRDVKEIVLMRSMSLQGLV